MGRRVEITLLCFITVVWFQQTLSDGPATSSDTDKWTCTCSIAREQTLTFALANCSSSCDCNPAAGGSDENRWTCICNAGGLPRLVGEENGSSCFTACNCNAGTLSELEPSKKRIPVKVVFIVLLLCLVLTAIGLAAIMLWHVYRKDKHPVQWASSSSDRLTSCSSAVNLMSHGSSPMPVYKGYLDSSAKPFMGCIPQNPFLLRRGTKALHGTIIQFSYSELENATDKFSDTNLVGVGGCSHVYRGNLRDGRTVAVKKMKRQGGPDAEHVFLAEIQLIARLHHCHVVPLLGYCLQHQGKNAERLLVFEYIPNGNLRECLDGELGQCLGWNTRVSIALGAARGLEYLHDAAAPRILHRDVKSTNILLDERWRAKITDLGMAKHLQNDGILSCSSSPDRMQGTFGYFAPEYAIVGRASLKSDVFSFGVVLLELITGRKPIHKSSNKGAESLVIWATARLHDSKRVIEELPDPHLQGKFEEEEMQVMAYLAKECLLLDPDSRPTMSEVVQILSTIAPDRSKRNNLPLRAFQCGMKSENPEMSDGDLHDASSSSTEEIKQITSEIIKNEKEEDDSPSDVEKLMLLTSKRRSSRGLQDDEVVDLTEPRLESFCLPNFESHVVKISYAGT
ncbi:receptor-like serine/threonine-protein kinase NCRK [Salvia miltiorrhiza]|uniref:receptor-like serine/threonine-protein kinase NCRK n=1 Tax=Salvia miltiorrhiza TaxID=226208 RepID=UPI0025AB6E76|nr:receptor-like serine/threonine-protein kinase NCRK [Salvia miltiorrhiza]XP_057782517.1 receptor-like serine/threonine-protein kinase NCRK [Salvia miltiorrhiza]XP_057782519.1 receptor-like serine/threonine-protein kinase NCRK [Salvia miltiorrhiza]XP_057782520.1 receptor-like serine/threonine-protein kinase NCRK [Salvia miltiorrhiza]XP_057782521.1 receptor-like serine/threonine-protein kinase NCRK [Salvia miltiorrhiza]